MRPEKLMQHIVVDEYSSTPKYIQLANSILNAIESGKLKKGDLVPSINELSTELEISRDTAEKGYRYLKKLEVLESVPSKGYYIAKSDFKQTLKIVLFFNKLSFHKKVIYDAFIKAIGEYAEVDFYIYNNDFRLFKKLLTNNPKEYSHFVIIPHFLEGGENAHDIINTIPKQKLVILDKKIPGIEGQYAGIFENFEKDIYEALNQARPQLAKYHTIKLVFPQNSYFPREIVRGFYEFCQQFAFTKKIVNNISEEPINTGEVFINLMEDDLAILIERVISLNLVIGKEVGIISYNETPLKKIILNGITTISTDFELLGKLAAEMILEKSTEHVEVPFSLRLRASL